MPPEPGALTGATLRESREGAAVLIRDALNRIVGNIRNIMKARGCIYWIVDAARQEIHMKATAGFQMDALSRIRFHCGSLQGDTGRLFPPTAAASAICRMPPL